MKAVLFLSALAAGAFVASAASFAQTFHSPPYQYLTSAQDRPDQGQYPLQSSLGDRTVQPQCGFAATQDWGPRMAFSGAIPKTYTQSRASISPMLLDNSSLPAERSSPALEPAGAVLQNSRLTPILSIRPLLPCAFVCRARQSRCSRWTLGSR